MAVDCSVCGWTFRSEEAVRKHMASHHEEELRSQQPDAHAHPGQEYQAAPGWYPNAQGEGERYWDGTEWTSRTQYSDTRSVGTLRLFLSYVAAFLFPIGGLVAGIFLLVRRRVAHGVAVAVISIGMGAAVILIPIHDSSSGGGHAQSVDEIVRENTQRAQRCFRSARSASARQLIRCVDRTTR